MLFKKKVLLKDYLQQSFEYFHEINVVTYSLLSLLKEGKDMHSLKFRRTLQSLLKLIKKRYYELDKINIVSDFSIESSDLPDPKKEIPLLLIYYHNVLKAIYKEKNKEVAYEYLCFIYRIQVSFRTLSNFKGYGYPKRPLTYLSKKTPITFIYGIATSKELQNVPYVQCVIEQFANYTYDLQVLYDFLINMYEEEYLQPAIELSVMGSQMSKIAYILHLNNSNIHHFNYHFKFPKHISVRNESIINFLSKILSIKTLKSLYVSEDITICNYKKELEEFVQKKRYSYITRDIRTDPSFADAVKIDTKIRDQLLKSLRLTPALYLDNMEVISIYSNIEHQEEKYYREKIKKFLLFAEKSKILERYYKEMKNQTILQNLVFNSIYEFLKLLNCFRNSYISVLKEYEEIRSISQGSTSLNVHQQKNISLISSIVFETINLGVNESSKKNLISSFNKESHFINYLKENKKLIKNRHMLEKLKKLSNTNELTFKEITKFIRTDIIPAIKENKLFINNVIKNYRAEIKESSNYSNLLLETKNYLDRYEIAFKELKEVVSLKMLKPIGTTDGLNYKKVI